MKPTLYTMTGCPSCERVKAALDMAGVAYDAVVIDDKAERQEFYDRIAEHMTLEPENVRRTMPKMQINLDWLASSDDMILAINSGFFA